MGIRTTAALSPADERAGDILRLRREIGRMQRRRSDDAHLPMPAALQDLLPQGGLQTGTVYSVSPSPSTSSRTSGPRAGPASGCISR